MSYIYLQELGEVSSVEFFADIPAFVLSRLNLTLDKFYCNDKEMECCQNSQYGMILPLSMENHGEDWSILFVGDSLVKTFPQQEKEQESPESDLDYGVKWHELLARYDLNTRSWRTVQCSLFEDLGECLETFPRWGMMRNGALSERTKSVLHISGIGFGFSQKEYLTPTATNIIPSDDRYEKRTKYRESIGRKYVPGSLCEQIMIKVPNTINQAVRDQKTWPTPNASDDRDRGNLGDPCVQRRIEIGKQINLSQSVSLESGALNPDWVEWLMNWPILWSSLEPCSGEILPWHTDPANNGKIPRVTKHTENRNKRLKAIGNGQVPQCAATAFIILRQKFKNI